MANTSGLSNVIKVNVGLVTGAVAKGFGNKQQNINANPNLSKDQKTEAIGKLQEQKSWAAVGGLAVAQGIDIGMQYLDYRLTDIGRANGDSNYQAQIDRTMAIASNYTNMALQTGGAFMGGMMMSGGNPLVGLVAGAISLTSSVAKQQIRIAGQNREYGHKLFEENNRAEYLRNRAGISDYNGRVR